MRKLVIFELPFRGRDEFLPLTGILSLDVKWVRPQDYKGDADVIILPGSAATVADLEYLRANGGTRLLSEHLSKGGTVIGVCGGYQMLGKKLYDPQLKQGSQKEVDGFGYLPIDTTFGPEMMRCLTESELLIGKCAGETVGGLEVRSGFSVVNPTNGTAISERFTHLNRVTKRNFTQPKPEGKSVIVASTSADGETTVNWAPGDEELDGLVSSDRKVWGTYLHLIFHHEAFVRSFLGSLP